MAAGPAIAVELLQLPPGLARSRRLTGRQSAVDQNRSSTRAERLGASLEGLAASSGSAHRCSALLVTRPAASSPTWRWPLLASPRCRTSRRCRCAVAGLGAPCFTRGHRVPSSRSGRPRAATAGWSDRFHVMPEWKSRKELHSSAGDASCRTCIHLPPDQAVPTPEAPLRRISTPRDSGSARPATALPQPHARSCRSGRGRGVRWLRAAKSYPMWRVRR